jgi:hypothetical protein
LSRNMGGNRTQELSPLSPLPWLPAIDCQSELKRRKKMLLNRYIWWVIFGFGKR